MRQPRATRRPFDQASPPSGWGDRSKRVARRYRVLEIIPGLVTWLLILGPIPLSLRYPQVVGWFVLCFDCYWLYRAAELAVSVCISFRRVRRVAAVDWRERAFALADPQARYDELPGLVEAIDQRIAELRRAGNDLAAQGGRREQRRLIAERRDLGRLLRSMTIGEQLPDPRQLWHVALIPTYTEPYEKLYETVKALAESDYPCDLKMVAIITRETDLQGRENVVRLREIFGSRFRHFFHILDPLEPGVVVGKSSAMAYGGRWLYRELTGLGFDPGKVIVTDLDSDYRVHPQYFGYLTYTFITDPDRYHRLYQPIPMYHNNLWQCPLPVRLVDVHDPRPDVAALTPEQASASAPTPFRCGPSTTWTTGRRTQSPRTAASTGRASSDTAASSTLSRSSCRCTAMRFERRPAWPHARTKPTGDASEWPPRAR